MKEDELDKAERSLKNYRPEIQIVELTTLQKVLFVAVLLIIASLVIAL